MINRDLRVGQRGAVVEKTRMGFDTHMGDHYPFIPTEMISVLLDSTSAQSGLSGRKRPRSDCLPARRSDSSRVRSSSMSWWLR